MAFGSPGNDPMAALQGFSPSGGNIGAGGRAITNNFNTPNIGGNLPWSNSASGLFGGAMAGNDPYMQALASQYGSAYNAALNFNQQNYNNILGGYQSLMGNQVSAENQIESGYGNLLGQVQNTLGFGGTPWGVAAPAAQAIADTYAQQSGALSQNMANSGLGNTTVASTMQRGPSLDAAKAYGSLGANLAQTYAGYQANLGEAALNYANQANMQNTALGSQELGWMNSINAPYPNAGMYAQLAQQRGNTLMTEQMAALQARQFQQQQGAQANQLASQNYNQAQDRALQMAMGQQNQGGAGYQGGGLDPYSMGGYGGGQVASGMPSYTNDYIRNLGLSYPGMPGGDSIPFNTNNAGDFNMSDVYMA